MAAIGLFESPSQGKLSLDAVFADVVSFIQQDPEQYYKLIVGTDSQKRDNGLYFVTAIVIHRRGQGARYYYVKKFQRSLVSLRQKIYYETSLSLAVASDITEQMSRLPNLNLPVEIHLDVGEQGATRDLIREVVGMVVGSGYHAKIKPESFGASSVADRYTK